MSEKLRVLEAMDVYLPDVDGVINCMHNYCLNLDKKTELTVVVPKNKKGYIDKLPYKIIRCKSVHIPFLNDFYGFPNIDRKFKKLVMSQEYDIVHVHSPFNMAKFALKVAKKKHIPAVATFHSNMRPIFKSVVKSKFLAELMVKRLGRLYNKFDKVFVCSPLVAEQLRSFGYKKEIDFLPFGTDFEKCEDVELNSKKANEKFYIQENANVFIYVGRIMNLKRIDFILRSLKLVKEKGIDFRFYVVGKGPLLNKLKMLSKELELEKNVVFTGFLPREDFPILFSRADLLLFPSLYDNFGLVKVEGAAYETPGVFIKHSCAGYGVDDGVDGFLADNTEESFADAIVKAIEDRDKLKSIGKNASNNLYINWIECSDILLKKLSEISKNYEVNDGNKK